MQFESPIKRDIMKSSQNVPVESCKGVLSLNAESITDSVKIETSLGFE